jgi:hypothetical protein
MDRIKLSTIRQKFPMYNDLSDEQLLIGVRKQFYPDIPLNDFTQRIEFDTQKYDPTEGMSTFDRVAAGAGKSVMDTVQGVKQLFGMSSQDEIDERAALDKPLMDTGAGMAGNIGGQIAQMVIPAGGVTALSAKLASRIAPAAGAAGSLVTAAAPYLSAAGQAGGFAALQPVETGDTRLGNAASAAALGAVGQGVSAGASRLAKGASDTIAPNIRALYEKAIAQGIPIRADQLGDSKFLKTLASTLQKIPGTGAQRTADLQQQAFNRAVSREMGEDVPAITSDVYGAAKRRIGQQFQDLTSRNNLNVTDDLVNQLAAITDEANRFASPDVARAVSNMADDFLRRVDPQNQVAGPAYQSMDSFAGKLMKGGGEKAHYLGQIRDALRTGMDDSISAVDQEAWGAARGQYRALKTVRDLVAKDPSGNISPALLAGRVGATNSGKEALASGTGGNLGDLAQIGRQFVRDPVPDSGTAQRLFAMMSLPVAGAGVGYATGDSGSSIGDALKGAALLSGSGFAANKLLSSPSASRYLVGGAPPAAQALLRSAKVAPMLLPAIGNAQPDF